MDATLRALSEVYASEIIRTALGLMWLDAEAVVREYPDWHSALAALRERYATMPLAVAEALVDRAHLEHLEESFTSAPLDLGKKI